MVVSKCEIEWTQIEGIKIVCCKCECEVYIKDMKSQFTDCPNCNNRYHDGVIKQVSDILQSRKYIDTSKDKIVFVAKP
jgi:PHP family Zn ribbon phosphoesterase